jgi:phosphatidylglycerophosphate synthase
MTRHQIAMRLSIVSDNPTLLWGISSRERISRMAKANGLTLSDGPAAPVILANAAFAFDPAWIKHMAANPDLLLTSAGIPVLAHVSNADMGIEIETAMREQKRYSHAALTELRAETAPELVNEQLRKRERPFVGALTPATKAELERASYAGAYKGVTDILTKYLWPGFAFQLTRLAAWIGLSPNMVTTIGFVLCIMAGYLFYIGAYWPGMVLGFLFMVLDTVDGKLARCTITSSFWGHIFDHGTDLIHPPIWWWALAMGLDDYSTPVSDSTLWITFAVIMGAYVVQRLIEGAFIGSFKMHIHVWQPFDTRFRLVTARRNPNMAFLVLFLLIGRPDLGYITLGLWGAFCCLVHLVRLGQAYARRIEGKPVMSWLGLEDSPKKPPAMVGQPA